MLPAAGRNTKSSEDRSEARLRRMRPRRWCITCVRLIVLVPFVRGFFGSPASDAFSYSVFLPSVRIGAAELYMTNAVGGGLVEKAAFGTTADQGLRTLAGGQLSIQAQGYLAIQTGATPPLVMEDPHVARDISAVVREAPERGRD